MMRLFSSQSKTITGAALVLGAASFASRLIGIVRDRIFAHMFGAGDVLDTYYAAFRVPDLVYNLLIVGALSAGFIPVFTELWMKKKQEAWEVTGTIINILAVSLVVVCSVLFVLTPWFTPLLVPGFDEEKLQLTIMLTRIMFVSPILLGVSAIVSGVLQSLKSFLVYSLTPIMYNLGIMFGAFVFVPVFGIAGLAYGVILGALLHLIIQLPTLYSHGFRYRPNWLWRSPQVREIGRLMIPRTLGLASYQLNIVITTVLASTLAVGSITVFNFASNLQYFPVGLFGVSFAVAAFPAFASFVAQKKLQDMSEHIASTTKQILFFIIPVTVLFLLLRAQIVRVVLGSGQFDWAATIATADTLALFSLSLFAQALILLLARAFYALKDTWTPFVTSFIATLLNIALALYLKNSMGVAGLALAFSIAMIVQMILLWIPLRIKLKTLGELSILQALYKIGIACILMSLLVQYLKAPLAALVDMTRLWGIFTQGFVAGLLGLIVYCGICYGLRLEEMMLLASSMKKKFLRTTTVQGEIHEGDEL